MLLPSWAVDDVVGRRATECPSSDEGMNQGESVGGRLREILS
jgi:hypothetical protein